jgi:hypothetical protein
VRAENLIRGSEATRDGQALTVQTAAHRSPRSAPGPHSAVVGGCHGLGTGLPLIPVILGATRAGSDADERPRLGYQIVDRAGDRHGLSEHKLEADS